MLQGLRGGAWWDGTDGRVAGWEGKEGSTSHSASQETKYYLLFEERHSRYLLYRGRGPACLEQGWANLKTKTTSRAKRLDSA